MIGALFLVLAASAQPEPQCRLATRQATAQMILAEGETARRKYRAASTRLDRALRLLGDDYASATTNDDTGMHLILAEDQWRKGRQKNSIELKRRVLSERLQLCNRPIKRR